MNEDFAQLTVADVGADTTDLPQLSDEDTEDGAPMGTPFEVHDNEEVDDRDSGLESPSSISISITLIVLNNTFISSPRVQRETQPRCQ